jgi:hypothetical protein
MSLCLVGAGVAVTIAAEAFSLSWTHTIEKTEWREEWRVEAGELVLEEASVKGSGAGMEPPAEARLEDGAYVWRPGTRHPGLVLRRDPHAGDWTLCAGGRCDPIGVWLGEDADPVEISAAAPCKERPR